MPICFGDYVFSFFKYNVFTNWLLIFLHIFCKNIPVWKVGIKSLGAYIMSLNDDFTTSPQGFITFQALVKIDYQYVHFSTP